VTRRLLTAAAIVLLLFLARLYLSTEGSTPEGQPRLQSVTGLTSLKSEFNRDARAVRVILLLAPSCAYCLKGASEIERVLARHGEQPIVVYAIWQPMLSTDWGKPGSAVMRRLSDGRVRQFWDANREVARAFEQSFQEREPGPACCFKDGIWWDLMAVFPPGGEWKDNLPEPVLLEGTVDEAAPAFDGLLGKMLGAAAR
jgi:hypothetical protein